MKRDRLELLFLALLAAASACAEGTVAGSQQVVPAIASFAPTATLVPAGHATALTAVFLHGTGTIDHGLGAVTSGVPISTGALTADTTFTLTVTGEGGATATRTASVSVVHWPDPVISAFSTGQSPIDPGQTTTLTATYHGGTAAIDQGVGTVQSGVAITVGPLTASTTYTLTVTNAAGATTNAQVTVSVRQPAPPAVTAFAAAQSPIASGSVTTLTATFSGGTGIIQPGDLSIASGMPVAVGPLTATTTFTLTVTGAGGTSSATTAVEVLPAPTIATFSAAAAVVTTGGTTSLLATFSGGTGLLSPGNVAVTSGVSVAVGPLVATTTYTLTVTNAVGVSASRTTNVSVAAAPTITGFAAARSPLTAGAGTTLTATFAGGSGTIDHGLGQVTSGVPVPTGLLAASATFTLTVANAAHSSVQRPVTVTVVPPPAVTAFAASPGTVTTGGSASLTATFSGGGGVITPGGIPVTSGTPVTVGPLAASTTYTLTVTNAAGDAVSQQVGVSVVPPSTITSFEAAATSVPHRGTTTLTAVFPTGTGSVDQGVGPVTSGAPVTVGPLTATTAFRLTVISSGGVTATADVVVNVDPAPSITTFAPVKSPVTLGDGTELTASYANGAGIVTPGNLPLPSGSRVAIGPLLADASFLLTVTNGAGESVTQTASVAVVPAPAITGFTASPGSISAGEASTLTPTFSGGVGTVDHALGVVTSGAGLSTGALGATASYRLTVANAAGTEATRDVTVTVVPRPAITAFAAGPGTVTAGGSTQLTATFSGGVGVITPGDVPVSSGTPVTVGPLAASTTYTLTVTGAAGVVVTAEAPVTVVEAPAIASFTPPVATVAAGGSITLTPTFTGGTGTVDHGVGAVASGVPVTVGPLLGSTIYTLTVTNAAGATATRTASVTVQPPVGTIAFTTQGASFSPVIVVTGSPTILWTFPDGSTSSSPRPTVSWGSAAHRITTLQVTPWTAVHRVNIGYDGGDGGPLDGEHVPDQQVSAVSGLEVLAPALVEWFSSYNLITALDFSNFVSLQDVEAFKSASLATVKVANTPALSRLCLEQTALAGVLDLTGSPNLADLRGADSSGGYTDIDWGAGPYASTWHICVRKNPQFVDRNMFADTSRWPSIAELWIWDTNQTGTLRVPSTHPSRPVSILAEDNAYTSVDLRGALQNPTQSGEVRLLHNAVTSIDLTGCVQVTSLDMRDNALTAQAKDTILATLDGLGRDAASVPLAARPPKVDLSGLPQPTAAGMASAASLEAKGWTVLVGPTMTP